MPLPGIVLMVAAEVLDEHVQIWITLATFHVSTACPNFYSTTNSPHSIPGHECAFWTRPCYLLIVNS